MASFWQLQVNDENLNGIFLLSLSPTGKLSNSYDKFDTWG